MTTPKAKLGTKWMDVHEIRAARSKAQTNREAQKRLFSDLKQRLEKRQSEVERSLSGLNSGSQNLVADAVAGYRRELNAESSSIRLAYVQTAGKLRDDVQSTANHYQSSPQMLARYTLGSEKRSRYIEQIAHSGPAELAAFAELAASTKNKDLAAALCSKVYQLEPTKRPFDAAELANVIVGDELKEIQSAFSEIERLALEAVYDDTAFETGKRNPGRDLHVAVMKQEEDNAAARGNVDV
ncbi:MAG: hypothetical protein ABJE77_06060 [Tateyamaria sp.]